MSDKSSHHWKKKKPGCRATKNVLTIKRQHSHQHDTTLLKMKTGQSPAWVYIQLVTMSV